MFCCFALQKYKEKSTRVNRGVTKTHIIANNEQIIRIVSDIKTLKMMYFILLWLALILWVYFLLEE